MMTDKIKTDLFLLITFILFAGSICYYYPMPQITYDGDSYIAISGNISPNLRPVGYSVFLRALYFFSHSISFVVYFQFFLLYISSLLLLKVTQKYCGINNVQYYIAGVILLAEPVALYHCNTILSDILFAALTSVYIATLLLLIDSKKTGYFILHLLLLCCCIETKYVALYYPAFSVLTFIFFIKKIKPVILYSIITISVFGGWYEAHIKWNKATFFVPIFSAFSGWTQANNALYAIGKRALDTSKIKDAEILKLYTFFHSYMDTTTFEPGKVGTNFLWEEKSPLNVIKRKLADSLAAAGKPSDMYYTWYLLSGAYGRFGKYIQFHFPFIYISGFVAPNLATLISPHEGEMADYDFAKNDISAYSLNRYHLTTAMLQCRQQIFKEHINAINVHLYHARLFLFSISLFVLLLLRKLFDSDKMKLLLIFILFVLSFYFMTLVTSWFMMRYLLPLFPLMTITIVVVAITIFGKKRQSDIQK